MTNKRAIPNQLQVSQIDQDEIVTWEAGRKTKKLIKLCQVYMHIKIYSIATVSDSVVVIKLL